jgi:hypothetical protein
VFDVPGLERPALRQLCRQHQRVALDVDAAEQPRAADEAAHEGEERAQRDLDRADARLRLDHRGTLEEACDVLDLDRRVERTVLLHGRRNRAVVHGGVEVAEPVDLAHEEGREPAWIRLLLVARRVRELLHDDAPARLEEEVEQENAEPRERQPEGDAEIAPLESLSLSRQGSVDDDAGFGCKQKQEEPADAAQEGADEPAEGLAGAPPDPTDASPTEGDVPEAWPDPWNPH